MSDQPDEKLTIDEVAACLKAAKRMVYRFLLRGELSTLKLRGTWCFRRAEIDCWIASLIGQGSEALDQRGADI